MLPKPCCCLQLHVRTLMPAPLVLALHLCLSVPPLLTCSTGRHIRRCVPSGQGIAGRGQPQHWLHLPGKTGGAAGVGLLGCRPPASSGWSGALPAVEICERTPHKHHATILPALCAAAAMAQAATCAGGQLPAVARGAPEHRGAAVPCCQGSGGSSALQLGSSRSVCAAGARLHGGLAGRCLPRAVCGGGPPLCAAAAAV